MRFQLLRKQQQAAPRPSFPSLSTADHDFSNMHCMFLCLSRCGKVPAARRKLEGRRKSAARLKGADMHQKILLPASPCWSLASTASYILTVACTKHCIVSRSGSSQTAARLGEFRHRYCVVRWGLRIAAGKFTACIDYSGEAQGSRGSGVQWSTGKRVVAELCHTIGGRRQDQCWRGECEGAVPVAVSRLHFGSTIVQLNWILSTWSTYQMKKSKRVKHK